MPTVNILTSVFVLLLFFENRNRKEDPEAWWSPEAAPDHYMNHPPCCACPREGHGGNAAWTLDMAKAGIIQTEHGQGCLGRARQGRAGAREQHSSGPLGCLVAARPVLGGPPAPGCRRARSKQRPPCFQCVCDRSAPTKLAVGGSSNPHIMQRRSACRKSQTARTAGTARL